MANLLPGYTYEKGIGRYRSEKTGRFVARSKITELLEQNVDAADSKLQNLAEALHEGKIDPSTFVYQAKTELKRAHLQNRAIGAGGWDNLDSSDFGAVGGRLNASYRKIIGTAEDIRDGKISLAQSKARMHSYMGDARRHYYDAEKTRRKPEPGTLIIYRRIAAMDAATCADCMNYYAMGWQLSLPSPGEACVCNGNCRCTVLEKTVLETAVSEWIGTKRA